MIQIRADYTCMCHIPQEESPLPLAAINGQ